MKRAWMPLYVGDYLGDTGHLGTTLHGAYFLLMMHYWRKGELPDNDVQLAAITKLPLRIWKEARPTLQAFFYEGWRHKRIDTELERMASVSEKRAAAGYKGGMRSAMGRMKLEGEALKGDKRQPIAKQLLRSDPSNCSNFAAAGLDHSHSHKNITSSFSSAEGGQAQQGRGASPELLALLGKKAC